MRAVCLVCLACLLGGCLKPAGNLTVQAVDEPEFRAMTVALRPQLEQKGILDGEGAWYSSLISLAGMGFGGVKNAGQTLLDRLSPAFRFPGTDPTLLPSTFRGMLTEQAGVTVTKHSFTVEQGLDRLYVSLLALADWDQDGKDDWLALCRVEPQSSPGNRRDYYLVITDLTPPVLTPRVLAVRDCADGRCRVVETASDPSLTPDSPAVELMQGQQNVTQPPRKPGEASPSPATHNGLREQALTQ